MPTVSSSILGNSSVVNLKAIPLNQVREEVMTLLVEGEDILQAFKTIRDQVIFTNKRVFVVNVQGLTGKKVSYFSYPYSKVLYFGVETAGVLDIDSELVLAFSNGAKVQFDFTEKVDIKAICSTISKYIL